MIATQRDIVNDNRQFKKLKEVITCYYNINK